MMNNLETNWFHVLRDQILISMAITVGAFALAGLQQAASVALGAGLVTLNIALLSWSWTRLFTKKSVALAGLIIVIKYAFFIGFLFWITQLSWVQGLWLMVGIVTFVPTSLLISWKLHRENELSEENSEVE